MTITPCRANRHCYDHGWCHLCRPDLVVSARYLVKALQAAGVSQEFVVGTYTRLARVIADAGQRDRCPQCWKHIGHHPACPTRNEESTVENDTAQTTAEVQPAGPFGPEDNQRQKLLYFIEQAPFLQKYDPERRRSFSSMMVDDFACSLAEVLRAEGRVWGEHSATGKICAHNADLIDPCVRKKEDRQAGKVCCAQHAGRLPGEPACEPTDQEQEDHE